MLRDGGIRYMCLRCDVLLLVPGFAFTMVLESDSLTRSLSPPPDLCLYQGPQTTLNLPGEARPPLAAPEASAAKYPQIPTVGPQEQLSPTPREGGVSRSHTLPGLCKGPEIPTA